VTDLVDGSATVVLSSPSGKSCVNGPFPSNGGGPTNWFVQAGGTYLVRYLGVTESSCNSIPATRFLAFIQNNQFGNYYANATGRTCSGAGTSLTCNYNVTINLPYGFCATAPVNYDCNGDERRVRTSSTSDNSVHFVGSIFTEGCGSRADKLTQCGVNGKCAWHCMVASSTEPF